MVKYQHVITLGWPITIPFIVILILTDILFINIALDEESTAGMIYLAVFNIILLVLLIVLSIATGIVFKKYFRFTPEGIYCYDGIRTIFIPKDDVRNQEKCKIEFGWETLIIKYAGEKKQLINGKFEELSNAMEYIKKYYGVTVIEKPEALKPVQVIIIDIKEEYYVDDGTYYLPVVKRINSSDDERIVPQVYAEMNKYDEYTYKSKEEAQKNLVGKQLTLYASETKPNVLYPKTALAPEKTDPVMAICLLLIFICLILGFFMFFPVCRMSLAS